MTRPLLCLVGMFKNEADNVRAVLESARAHVDAWCIADTGSTDGTQDIILDTMKGIPGTLHHEPWRTAATKRGRVVSDFSANRNRVLDLAEGIEGRPVFTLFLSGHETMHVHEDALRRFLEAHRDGKCGKDDCGCAAVKHDGAYCVEMRTGSRAWPFTRILRVDGGWRYDRRIHECPIGPDGEQKATIVPRVTVVHAPPPEEQARKMSRIIENDLPTLEDEVDDESVPLEARGGSILFLGETHALIAADLRARAKGTVDDGGPWLTHQLSAMSMYWRYATIANQPDRPGFDARKRDYALAIYFNLAGEMPNLIYSHAELAQRLEKLCMIAPKLPEAHFLLAKHSAQAPNLGPKVALYHAIEASKVAREAITNPTYEVTETSILWRALVLGADCAGALGEMAKGAEERIKRKAQRRVLLEQAVKCGAPPELLRPPAPPAPSSPPPTEATPS